MTILIIGVYLVGCVVAYFFMKWCVKKDNEGEEWTIGDRRWVLPRAFLSWIAVLVAAMAYPLSKGANDHKPAKW